MDCARDKPRLIAFDGWCAEAMQVRGVQGRVVVCFFRVLRGANWLVPRGSRRGGACHAGEARAMAAMARRIAARPQSWAAGQADAMAILMRRTLMRTSAPY